MKTSLFRTFIGAIIACVALLIGPNLFAGPGPGELLRDAYRTLERADHDYKGHRAAAMKQVEDAAKLVGMNVRGDGHGHETQGVSDEQLRTARGLLEQVRPELKGKALKHVNEALHQISVALKIK